TGGGRVGSLKFRRRNSVDASKEIEGARSATDIDSINVPHRLHVSSRMSVHLAALTIQRNAGHSTPQAPRPPLRHLWVAAHEDLRNPIGVGETAIRKSLKLPIHVVFHATDRRLSLIH